MARSRVALVTPSLNSAAFLDEALASIQSQRAVLIDHVVVDGGSSDGSLERLHRADVRTLVVPGLGQSAAINRGWRETEGDIVAWLNADDRYVPGAVREAVAFLDANPSVDIVYGDCNYVDARGRRLGPYPTGAIDPVRFVRDAVNCLPQPATFLRRRVLEAAGGLDESLHHAMDFDLWLRLTSLGCVFRHLAVVLAELRLHGAAKSVRSAAAFAPELVQIYDRLLSQPGLPAWLRAVRHRASSNARYRASHCLFWSGCHAEARDLALDALARAPLNLKPHLGSALVGRPARRFLERWRGDPFAPPADFPRVALVCGRRLDVGGVEAHLLALAAQCRAGIRLFLAADASQGFAAKAADRGLTLLPWRARHGADLGALAQLLRLLRANPVDLLHVHDPRALPLAQAAALWLGLPTLATVHIPSWTSLDGRPLSLKRRLAGRVESWFHRRLVREVVYVSERALADALRLGRAPGPRSSVIENAVAAAPQLAADARSAIRLALGTSEDGLVLVCVARLDAQKGIDVLLDALALLPERTDLRLWIAGDGFLRPDLERQAGQHGLGPSVRFLGFREDVGRLLAGADAFVLPSRCEGMSIALLEALDAGLPCVVTDTGENRRLVEAAGGLAVPPGDAHALAEGLLTLLRDPGLRARRAEATPGTGDRWRAAAEATADVYARTARRRAV